MNILLVDDDADVRQIFAAMIETLGKHEITQACNGAEGCREFLEGEFDLIISDFMMPSISQFV